MLSWERIENVVKLIPHYLAMDIIGEIIIFNNNSKYDLKPNLDDGGKVRLIQSSHDFGLYTRFVSSFIAQNDCILFVDDDISVPADSIMFLYNKWKENTDNCHGIIGRDPSYGYNWFNSYGEVKIVLTRCLITHRNTCLYAMALTSHFNHLRPIPVGNGEDIILSYSAILISGSMNIAYRLPWEDLDDSNSGNVSSRIAIHQRYDNHFLHRQQVVEICEKLLSKRNSSRLRDWKISFPLNIGSILRFSK